MHDMTNGPLETTTLLTWLSALFAAPPTIETVVAHRRGAVGALLEALSQQEDFTRGAALIRSVLDKPSDDASLVAELGRTYGLLFEGIGGPVTIPPYESVFRPGAAWRLFQEPFSEMNALINKHGLSVVSDTLPADHLSIELALAAQLAATNDPAFAEMAKRLASWVPGFTVRCIEADEQGFWGGASLVLAAVICRIAAIPEANDVKIAAL
jgi:TorA-specific chaperone